MKNLKNVSQSPITLTDFNGVVIQPNEVIDCCMFGEEFARKSNDISEGLLHNHLAISDAQDTAAYTGIQGIQFLQGLPTRTTIVGTQIFTPSDRPAGTKRFYTGAGDNLASQTKLNGQALNFNVPPNSAHSIDMAFLEEMWIKDGTVYYIGAELGSYLTCQVVCPAGMPYVSFDKTGNFDFDGTNWTPNASNTGGYSITNEDRVVETFVNKYPLLGNGPGSVSSPEPDSFPAGYAIRLTIYNAHDTDNLKASIVLGMYRNKLGAY